MNMESIDKLNELLDEMDALSTIMLLRECYSLEEIDKIGKGEKIEHK